MKTLLLLAACLTLSTSAIAAPRMKDSKDPRPAVTFTAAENGLGKITITGKEAQKIYDSLDVEAEFEFGFVQLHTKRLKGMECSQAILGDIPGKMAGPRYTCEMEIALR